MRRRQPAQVYVWTAVILGLLLLFAGVVADAGRAFTWRVELQRLADAAARVGATQLDEAALRGSPESCPQLDPGAAHAAAVEYLAGRPEVAARIEASFEAVAVDLRVAEPTTLLGLFGVEGVEIAARGVAVPRAGVEQARPGCGP